MTMVTLCITHIACHVGRHRTGVLPCAETQLANDMTCLTIAATPGICARIMPGNIPEHIKAGALLQAGDFGDCKIAATCSSPHA